MDKSGSISNDEFNAFTLFDAFGANLKTTGEGIASAGKALLEFGQDGADSVEDLIASIGFGSTKAKAKAWYTDVKEYAGAAFSYKSLDDDDASNLLPTISETEIAPQPVYGRAELFALLDRDGSGELTKDEVVTSADILVNV